MPTSGSVDFSLTRDELIKSALRLCGVIDVEETPTAAEISDGSEALNIMIKSWATLGIGLWANQECTLFLQPNQTRYRLGTASGADHCTASHVETTTTSDEVAGAQVIELTSSSGMTVGDNIGIVLDSGDLHWDTVATIPTSTKVTITTGIASDAAAGAVVFAYTSKIGRPLQIIEARRRSATVTTAGDGTDLEIRLIARLDYAGIPNKTASGVISQAFYDPQLSLGFFNVWPASESSRETVRMTIKRTIEDLDDAGNSFDFPQEWMQALKYGLAAHIGMEYSINPAKLDRIMVMAEKYRDEAAGFDSEGTSFSFYPSEF
ncbi:MAG: hypothetical protein HQL90_04270 [Magnetococcales bacterium]|nr:hypothetical protein [Magnetococcales bacterium]